VDAGLTRLALLAAATALLPGCYYGHLLKGQYELLSGREPIDQIVARPGTDPALRRRLERALDARRFASRELKLPDNGSYTTYADLGRSYAVWNVFAAPELSLEPHEWCYPFLGCLAYRGYYDPQRARDEADELREDGLDVMVSGIAAYSTLGWFDDPLLNTIGGTDDDLAGTIFHELAHQVEFAEGDTAFNESFASFVEQEGLKQYLKAAPELIGAARQRQQREGEFVALMLAARVRLEAVYAGAASDAAKREHKVAEFARLRSEYAALKQGWGGDTRFDGWMNGEPNNARLLPFGLYQAWVPAFEALFRRVGGDWKEFYREVGELADLDEDERQQRLEALKKVSGTF
jgi:predicted aminopeptidase